MQELGLQVIISMSRSSGAYIQGVRKVTIQSYKLLYSFIVLYEIVFVTI